jgi:hypothetical protein
VAIAEEAAQAPDPWEGLGQFLERSLDQLMSNRALLDMITHAPGVTPEYGTELFDQLQDRVSGPLEHLLARGRQAGVVRADIGAIDFAPMLRMLSSLTDAGVPGLPKLAHRYMSLILAGLRPGGPPLDGKPPTREQLRAAAVGQVTEAARGPREQDAGG